MAEADFEIDFYGDTGNDEQSQQQDGNQQHETGHRDDENNGGVNGDDDHMRRHSQDQQSQQKGHEGHEGHHDGHQDGGASHPAQKGTKRKSEEDGDDRPIDSSATSAVMISELNWWTTDDDIRGWLRQADAESEVKDLTFSEHKVNGKSKG